MRGIFVLAAVGALWISGAMDGAFAQEAPAPGATNPQHAQDAGAATGWIKQVVTRIRVAQIGRGIKVKNTARV